ncbi:hypothetical protein [Arcanobacterium ihumii]|uniref:hypothetical protein n=1 Tax=Arcanobacterium ihumii TaxID=2138162 RepID=UPI001F38868F|nr:hypothetical protein [Arcanobacterium ihumii]
MSILEGEDGAFAGYEVCSRIGAMPFEPDVEWTCAKRIGEFPSKKRCGPSSVTSIRTFP